MALGKGMSRGLSKLSLLKEPHFLKVIKSLVLFFFPSIFLLKAGSNENFWYLSYILRAKREPANQNLNKAWMSLRVLCRFRISPSMALMGKVWYILPLFA